MTPQSLNIIDFLDHSSPILDVRSPSEFNQGHIPHAISLALFNDDERAKIGTQYKKASKQEAITLGLKIIAPHIQSLSDQAFSINSEIIKVHCWRGGMRSGFIAHLLEYYEKKTITLEGGYKSFRRWVIQKLKSTTFSKLIVLTGLTGTGKTAILNELQVMGEQVIDLEKLANHKGSAFGGIGLSDQPTQEQFENDLAIDLKKFDLSQPIWIEDESRLIGNRHIPNGLFNQLREGTPILIECSIEERLRRLIMEYGTAPKEQLIDSVNCISKRLGGLLTNEIKRDIENGDLEKTFEKLLSYYDKCYLYQMTRRKFNHSINAPFNSSSMDIAKALIDFLR